WLDSGSEGVAFVCPACGAKRIPKPCPECGHDDLRVLPGDGAGTMVVCSDCTVEFEDPPVRGEW
ncbi:MAG: hypothetical protein QXG03_08540, partial [Halalkalicoccus sp.]